eukprot:scaffold8343_cov54-Cylindrotheca_fusiformis.AAC.2
MHGLCLKPAQDGSVSFRDTYLKATPSPSYSRGGRHHRTPLDQKLNGIAKEIRSRVGRQVGHTYTLVKMVEVGSGSASGHVGPQAVALLLVP